MGSVGRDAGGMLTARLHHVGRVIHMSYFFPPFLLSEVFVQSYYMSASALSV